MKNKNEFKLSILNQFRTKEAPIHMLMVDNGSIALCHPKTTYLKQFVFASAEHKVWIYIDSILIDEEIKFQIQFKDCDDFNAGLRLENRLVDIANPEISSQSFYRERIRVENEQIHFSVIGYQLKVNDFEFSLNETFEGYELIFDFNEFKFVSSMTVGEFIQKSKELRERIKGPSIYCDAIIDNSLRHEILKTNTAFSPKFRIKGMCNTLFLAESILFTFDKSIMLKFIDELDGQIILPF